MKSKLKKIAAVLMTLIILSQWYNPVQASSGAAEPQLAAGDNFSLALSSDGTVKAWGDNSYGQLGIGSMATQKTPVEVPGLTNVKQLAARGRCALALLNDGTVKAWGENYNGQLGIGSIATQNTPMEVSGLTHVKQLAMGAGHTVALLDDGTVKAFGANGSGQLGIGNTATTSGIVDVPGLSNVKQLAAGAGYTVALLNDGTVTAWGANNNGQLGIGIAPDKYSPFVVSGLMNVKQLAAGAVHAVALLNDGTVKVWGYNGNGQLGIGNTVTQDTPTEVPGLTDVKQLAVGSSHTVALQNDGKVWAWGRNSDGQLGIGSTASQNIPGTVPGLTNVKQVASGSGHIVAVLEDGTVKAWGRNFAGQLGIGTTDAKMSPTAVNSLVLVEDNNNLSSLNLSNGVLLPGFDSAVTNYTVSVDNSIAEIAVTPTATDGEATIKVQETGVISGAASGNIPLTAGPNSISIKVTARNGDVKEYKINVIKAASNNNSLSHLTLSNGSLSPGFSDVITEYTASVNNEVTEITVTPTVMNGETAIKVNGNIVASGATSSYIALAVGENTITIEVNAGSGAVKNYTIKVTRAGSSNNNLSGLILSSGTLSPAFSGAATNYTASVGYAVTGISVIPTTTSSAITTTSSSITVNGDLVNSGEASPNIALNVGENTITIIVTAEDMTQRIYTVKVTRLANTNNGGGSSQTPTGGSSSPAGDAPQPSKPKIIITVTKEDEMTYLSAEVPAEKSSGSNHLTAQVSKEIIEAVLEKYKENNLQGHKVTIILNAVPADKGQDIEVKLSKELFNLIPEDTNLEIHTDIGTLTFDKQAIKRLQNKLNSDGLMLRIHQLQPEEISKEVKAITGDRPIYEFTLFDGQNEITDFGEGAVKVSIPYTLQPGENPDAVVVYYLNEAGQLQMIQGRYNSERKCVEFTVHHFSKYVIGYHPVTFTDVLPTDKYYKAISFAAARNITSGLGNNCFASNNHLTRGQFIVMLMKAYNIEPLKDTSDNFTDAGSTYYTGYLAAAKKLGISEGIGGNKFAPKQELTRQEMIVLLYNTLSSMGKLPKAHVQRSLSDFEDVDLVSGWAKESMSVFIEAGIIGKTEEKLLPLNPATRAEMAEVLYALLAN